MNDKPQIIVKEFRNAQNAKGDLIEEVLISPASDPLGTATWHRIKELLPPENGLPNDDMGTKIGYMKLRWAQIEGAYRAWKEGAELPLTGTPLAVWPGISAAFADIFRQHGIKTIEGVRDMTETIMGRVRLPNVRDLRASAAAFLENKEGADVAAKMAAKDAEIEQMREMMEEMAARLAAVDGGDPVKRGPGRPKKPVEAGQDQ